MRRKAWPLLGAGLVCLAMAGCGDDPAPDEPAGGTGGAGSSVEVTLQEWAVLSAQDSVAAGSIRFDVTNTGPDHDHELVVIRTELTPEELPTDADGVVDENAEGLEVIGEVAEFPPDETRTATVDLEAGSYVLICNIAPTGHEGEHGEGAHYRLGMRTGFTVT